MNLPFAVDSPLELLAQFDRQGAEAFVEPLEGFVDEDGAFDQRIEVGPVVGKDGLSLLQLVGGLCEARRHGLHDRLIDGMDGVRDSDEID